MRVLHVIETLGRGGAERLLVTLLPALAAQGVTPAVAVLRPPYDLQPELEAAGVKVIRLEQSGKWRLIRMARAIAGAARAHQAELVQAHLYFPGLGVALMRRLRLHRAATVMTYHNLAYAGANRDGIKLRANQAIGSILLRFGMDGHLAVSNAVSDHYATALKLPKPYVIQNPIDPLVFSVKIPPLKAQVQKIVVPGRLVSEKGHADFLASMKQLSLPKDISIVFAGGGPNEDYLRQQAEPLGVKITGPLTHWEILSEMASADLVVIPSRYEGFGIAAVEALALGRPVIATTAGGLPQAIGSYGILVPPGNPELLAHAISRAIGNARDRLKLGGKAQEGVMALRAEKISQKYIRFYEEVERKRSPHSERVSED